MRSKSSEESWESARHLFLMSFAASSVSLWLAGSSLSLTKRTVIVSIYILVLHLALYLSHHMPSATSHRRRIGFVFIPVLAILAGGIFGNVRAIWLFSGVSAVFVGLAGSFWITRPAGIGAFFGAHVAMSLAGILMANRLDPVLLMWLGASWVGALHFTRTRAAFSTATIDIRPSLNLMFTNVTFLSGAIAVLFIPFAFLSTRIAPAPAAISAMPLPSESSPFSSVDPEVIRAIRILILAISATLIAAIILYLRKSRKQKFKLLHTDPDSGMEIEIVPEAPPCAPLLYTAPGLRGYVIDQYTRLLGDYRKAGYPRETSETVREYTRRLASLFPDAADPLKLATAVYQRARYGTTELDQSDYDRFGQSLMSILSKAPMR